MRGKWSIYDRSCAREKDRDQSCRCRNRRQSEYGACRFRRVGRQWWNSCRSKSSTSDANISAIGDCVVFPTPYATKPVRIESVQNATDQARCLAARLVGKGAPYRSLPWFWSDQGSDKLQIV